MSIEQESFNGCGFITRLGCTKPRWCNGSWCMANPPCSDITIRTGSFENGLPKITVYSQQATLQVSFTKLSEGDDFFVFAVEMRKESPCIIYFTITTNYDAHATCGLVEFSEIYLLLRIHCVSFEKVFPLRPPRIDKKKEITIRFM